VIESTKHGKRNSNTPEELERTRQKDADERPPKVARKYQPMGKQSRSCPNNRRRNQFVEES
jgi:hypothetical protein